MKITVLTENTAISSDFASIHGLSLFIETEKHRLLFDLGPDETLLKNAQTAGIDLASIDTVIISHGHYDHGGALAAFLAINSLAKIYLQFSAFDRYFYKGADSNRYIGLDVQLKTNEQIVFAGMHVIIDEELQLFSGVTERKFYSPINQVLYMDTDNGLVLDPFAHEQNLIITENNKHYLIAGCAHNGIVNIIEKAEQLTDAPIDHALAGFHLYNQVEKTTADKELIAGIANALTQHQTHYFTGHCTGPQAYTLLKKDMGDQIDSISAGMSFEI